MKFLKKETLKIIALILTLTLVLPGTSVFATEISSTEAENISNSETSESKGESKEEILETLEDLEPGTDYAEGEFIVGFKDNVNTEKAAAKIESSDEVSETEVIGNLDSAVVTVADDENLADVMAEVSENKNVEYVEPNYYMYVLDDTTQTETYDEQLTAEEEIAETDDPVSQYYLDTINITGLWELVTDKAKYVSKYAIIDSGCLMTHEDLQTIDKELSVDVTSTDSKGNYIKLVNDPTPDPLRHGTSVASVSSSEANNGKGIAGVTSCYTNDKVDTFVVGVADNSGSISITAFAKGIDYAIENGANVINTSLGTYTDSETMKSAVKKAYEAGVIVIGSGGNREWYTQAKWRSLGITQDATNYPSDYEECISVTALNQLGRSCAYYSTKSPSSGKGFNYGIYKDLTAPGVGISCAVSTSDSSDSVYGTGTGTSYSGPIVASVVALLFTLNPDLTFDQVYKILTETATDVNNGVDVDWTYEGFDPYTGYGLINAAKAGCEVAGHKFTDYKVNADGTHTGTCKYCGLTETETHSLKNVKQSEATCTKQGYKMNCFYCSECGFYFSDSEGKNVLTKDECVEPALGHCLEYHKAVEPTETTIGNIAYYSCSRCGKYYSAKAGKTEIEEDSWIILSTPVLESVKNSETGITVKWNKVPGAGKYRVFYQTGTGSWVKAGDTASTSFNVTGLKSGKTYKFTVRCLSEDESSYISKYDKTGLSLCRLEESKITRLVNVKTAAIRVTWTENKKATGYQICVKKGSSKQYITIKNNTTLTKKIKNLELNTTYKVYVRSYKTVSGKNYFSNWDIASVVVEK